MNTEEWKKNKCADCDNLVSITDWSEGNDPRKYCDKCYDDDDDEEDCEGEYLETKCEDCDIINCEDFSYYENRCGDCCYKKDMRNREYEREQKNIRQKKINELDRQIDLRGVELLEIIQGLGTELKNKYETREEGKLLIKQAIEIGNILDKIAFREDGRL
tara:strand:- start:1610 stop:2089 length:480 start_codon:yes stop_codon:yes gene_type:complete